MQSKINRLLTAHGAALCALGELLLRQTRGLSMVAEQIAKRSAERSS